MNEKLWREVISTLLKKKCQSNTLDAHTDTRLHCEPLDNRMLGIIILASALLCTHGQFYAHDLFLLR